MNQHEEHDDLWELLGKARAAKPSPFFARNVLRAIRHAEPAREPGFVEWLRTGWNSLLAAGAVAVVLLLTVGLQSPTPQAGLAATDPVIEEFVSSPDFAVIENLELLVAMDDNDLWLQNTPY